MTSSTPRSPGPLVLSRHTRGRARRWNVRAENLNAWCRIAGDPFEELSLRPNEPEAGQVRVSFEPAEIPDVDAFTFFLRSSPTRPHPNKLRVDVSIVHRSGAVASSTELHLVYGEEATATLVLDPKRGMDISLLFGVSFEALVDPSVYGSVDVRYVVGYRQNELNALFNGMGSDKGTEISVGGGVPHCYGTAYYPLFQPFRQEPFNLLEIGLENLRDPDEPSDAPSLRAWRKFFPNATIYGYDIKDFSFFQQRDTFTFQGDQSSRQDLERFAHSYGNPSFRLVLDDGSHASSHQQISLAALFPHVEPHGLYVIEDLHWQPFEEAATTLEVLRTFAETGRFESPFVTDPEARYLASTIAEVEVHKPNDSEFAVIRKGDGGET